MTDTPLWHVDRAMLQAARRGELSEGQLLELLLAHVEELCPTCRRESEAARTAAPPPADYGGVVRRVRHSRRLREEIDALAVERSRVPELLATLRGLAPGQRLLRLKNAPKRYASRALCEALFDEARACLPADPAGSRGWAETATAMAALYPVRHPAHEARALAFRGNAARAAGDFLRAEEFLEGARRLMAEHHVADPDLVAELHSFFGSLRTDIRRLTEAEEHLAVAAHLYQALERDEELARVVMKLATLHRHRGEMEAALEADREAAALLSPKSQPRLYLAARFNLASNLAAAGEPEAARDVLLYDLDLYEEHADPHTRVRVRWLEGRLAAAAGEPEVAEGALVEVRDEFAAQEHGFNAALVCLDLAELYHRQGRLEDLQEAAGQAVALFRAHEIHREALAALLLLQEAAAARRVTVETLHQVAAFLGEAAKDPAARVDQTF